MIKKRKTTAVALSGGIDSAMTAYLLQQQGYDLIGITMSTWNDNYTKQKAIRSGCFGPGEKKDIASARKICETLNIPHHVIDLRKEFHNIVLEYFRKAYLRGKTPNPCVLCNREIKFGLLPEKAREKGLNFEYYATGHYARIVEKNKMKYIARGIDPGKDQSYFLCRLDEKKLATTLLPLGGHHKSEIREIAQKAGFDDLVTRKESQDFIETEDYGFIFEKQGREPGDIVDQEGNFIGRHKGIIFYTVGQRRGLNVSGLPEPYYVLEIDHDNNLIIAGPNEKLYKSELIAGDVLWADGAQRKKTLRITAKIRLQHQAAKCEIMPLDNDRYRVTFDQPQMSVTPGQIIAFYEKDLVLGGGLIEKEETAL